MDKIVVKIRCEDGAHLPTYATEGAAGVDLSANVSGVIKKGEVKLVTTGIYIEIPYGYEAQVRPRSGLALKHGITVLNSPGTIDSDYRGEIGIILVNFGDKDFYYNKGDRLAQVVFNKVVKAEFIVSDKLETTKRGEGGFGHTGVGKIVKVGIRICSKN